MPPNSEKTYAILGATGQTGSEITKYLAQHQPSTRLHIYARNASLLKSKLPSHSNITPFTGPLTASLLTSCIRDCSVIFNVVATNTNKPRTSIAQDTARALITALEQLKTESSSPCPTVILLSAPILHPTLSLHTPLPFRWLLRTGLSYVYDDLRAAHALFAEHPWIPVITAMPGGLIHADAVGTVQLSADDVSPMVSYADLARAMVRMAEEGKDWVGKDVGVVVTGGPAFHPDMLKNLFRYVFPGVLYHFVPAAWSALGGEKATKVE